jgi:asparagine synthase (glutamine-hydrolysing)
MRGIAPEKILDRRDKIGFATPEKAWLMELRPWVRKTLESDAAGQIAALNLQGVREAAELVLDGKRPFDWRLWRWLNLICWTERWNVAF